MRRQAAESPSYYDVDMLDCPGRGRNNNDSGQMPLGDGTGRAVAKTLNNGINSFCK